MTLPLELGGIKDPDIRRAFEQISLRWGSSSPRSWINYVIGGAVTAATVVPKVPVPLSTGQTGTIVSVYSHITSGTSVGVQLRRNGTNVGSVITATTTDTDTTVSQALVAGDKLDLVLSAPVATPSDLSFSIVIERTA